MVAIPRILKMGICNSPHFIHLETEIEENSVCPLEQGLPHPFAHRAHSFHRGSRGHLPGTREQSAFHIALLILLWRGGSTQCSLWHFCSLSWHRNWVLSSEGLSPEVLTTEAPGDSPLHKL